MKPKVSDRAIILTNIGGRKQMDHADYPLEHRVIAFFPLVNCNGIYFHPRFMLNIDRSIENKISIDTSGVGVNQWGIKGFLEKDSYITKYLLEKYSNFLQLDPINSSKMMCTLNYQQGIYLSYYVSFHTIRICNIYSSLITILCRRYNFC